MRLLLGCVLGATALAGGQGTQTFTGIITDEMCPTGSHAQMRMGPTDAECARACIQAHGSRFVLYDGTRAYILSDQQAPDAFAARKVTVTGTLDAKTMPIRVASIEAARQ
jgi:hypothetical protein